MNTVKTKSVKKSHQESEDNSEVVKALTDSHHSSKEVHQEGKFIHVKFNKKNQEKYLQATLVTLSNYPQYIYSLDFSSCRLKDKGAKLLIQGIIDKKINIRVLNLDFNDITDESCPEIVNLINKTQIRKLSITTTPFDCIKPCISSQAEKIMTPAILQSKTLEALNLAGQSAYRYGQDKDQVSLHLKANKKLNSHFDESEQANETQLSLLSDELEMKLSKAEATIEELQDKINKLKAEHDELLSQNNILKRELETLSRMPEVKRHREESAAIRIQHAFRIFQVKNNEKKKEHITNYVNNCLNNGDYEIAGILCGYLKEKAYNKAVELIEKRAEEATPNDANPSTRI